MEMLDAPGYSDTVKEYGELIEKIEDCFERINILKREIDAVKERKLRELDEKEIAGYDRIIGMLKVACSQVKTELSTYDARMKELDAYSEPGTHGRDELASMGYNSSSGIRG